MKHLIISAALLMSLNCIAEGDGHIEAAYQLLEVSGAEYALDASIKQMAELELQSAPALLPYKEILLEYYHETLDFDLLKDEYANIYMDHFSEAELRELIEFHDSDIGKKITHAQPIILRQSAELGQQRVMETITVLQDRIRAEAERIRLAKDLDQQGEQ